MSFVEGISGEWLDEMEGQEVTVVGMVATVRKAMTRNNRPFVSAVLEDIGGEIEVTAWSEVYERTEELWKEGNTLLARGKVRLRGERVQLNCQGAVAYRPGEPLEIPWATGSPPPATPTRHHQHISDRGYPG
ncbi:OB-fold nucleic acid binding domain-containing protein [Dehalococcoidia bacterium]|nr:OB-fold nucleic acid binding domain-containing protein [Dehalococcoidia bacterium]